MFIKNKILFGKSDLYTGLILIVFSIFLYINSFNLANVVAFYPRIMLVIICLIGVIFILRPIKKFEKDKINIQSISSDVLNKKIKNMSIITITLIIFWLAAPIVGYYLSLFFYVYFVILLIGGSWRISEIVKSFIYSITFVIVLYIMFKLILKIQTPTGIFFKSIE